MGKTLLCIHSYEGAKPLVDQLWSNYQLPGWDIFGICPEDSSHPWLPDIKSCALIAKSCYLCPDLIKRFVGTFDHVLNHREFDEYDSFCVTEYDAVFLRQPPEHPGGLFTHLAGGGIGTKATRFYHGVWWPDRTTAAIIVDEGKKLMAAGEWEAGSPDVFLGLICDRRPEIVIHETFTWSCNGGDLQNRWPEAEKCVRDPRCFYAHGVRSMEEVDRLRSYV